MIGGDATAWIAGRYSRSCDVPSKARSRVYLKKIVAGQTTELALWAAPGNHFNAALAGSALGKVTAVFSMSAEPTGQLLPVQLLVTPENSPSKAVAAGQPVKGGV